MLLLKGDKTEFLFSRFILAKIICHNSQNVAEYVEELLEQCMLFRSGHGIAPVLFEER